MEFLWWAGLAALVVVAAVLGLWWRQRGAAQGAPLDPSDRFARVAALSPIEGQLLDYLVRAFPGRAVLFRAPLSRIVAVRRARNRLGAQQRLADHMLDYVVCDREGKPVYAFELDALHDDPDEAAQDAAEKHRVLKTAGIRLIRLKRSTRDLPSPAEFRRHLRTAALPTEDGAEAAVTAGMPLETAAPGDPELPPRRAATPDFHDTQPMTVTNLMDLPPARDDPDDAPETGQRRSA